MQTVAVLLAGGTGTRLYPASRRDRPKQFRSFDDGPPLLRRTADRVGFADEVYAVTSDRYADRVAEVVPEAEVLVEPYPRDTGPALVYAARRIREAVGECVLCCLPTDHHIGDDPTESLTTAVSVAEQTGSLVTVGVSPTRAATGYGYIEPGTPIADGAARRVQAFHEKPGPGEAAEYIERNWLWNAGIFAWTPTAFLEAVADSSLASFAATLEADGPDRAFETVSSVSVDHAVLETATDLVVVPTAFEWDDVGTWDAVGRVFGQDLADRSVRIDAPRTVVAADEDTHVSVLGVEDLVVAAYEDRVLVCPRSASERVREVVDALDTDD